MSRRAELAGRAYQEALRLRSRTNRRTNVPLCPFDVAEEIGVEVRFTDIPSLEAMYVNDGSPKIVIGADRPPGRQRFSCAHELGHHVFGHGTHLSCLDIAQADTQGLTDEEFIAQAFAGFLLLPKAAVSYSFSVRKWDPRQGIPEQFYLIAGLLGVSFEALVTHCERVLRVLASREARALFGLALPQLRARIAGQAITGNLTHVDAAGLDTAVDLRVGDHLLGPPGSTPVTDALVLEGITPSGPLLRACRPGLSGLRVSPDEAVGVVRIARADYVGRSVFRHLEDPDHA